MDLRKLKISVNPGLIEGGRMYFKQLELVGFKSFPHKTRLKFEPGVTAIVGPNGCGKSNIADAINWVLGEQSPRSLRGSAMEDVIFSGTDSVKPINMAEVSLTLSNDKRKLPIDYNEITITRRLFRSGESEYILNKTPVRLKDITSLLMGTGIGTSSYSIIEQGKIDLILSSKPEERRYIFEEASGITKYKSKKREATRKLEHTENNLVRINDIINEVKRQINSIERHAKKAERYKNDFEIMKELDLKFATSELKNINNDLMKDKKDLESISQKEEKLRFERDEITALINKYREDMDNVIRDLTETQKKRSDTALFIDKANHRVELNRERVNDLANLKAASVEELTGLVEKTKLQEEEIERIKKRFDDTVRTKEERENALIQKEESVRRLSGEINVHQKDIKSAKNRTLDLLAFQTKTKNELIKLGADVQNRKMRLRRLETERENIEEEKKNIESLLNGASAELDKCKGKVEEKSHLTDELKNRFASCESALEDIRRRVTESENVLNSLRSKEEILKEVIENFEGFSQGVKLVMEKAKKGFFSGVIGIVADMLEPEKEHEAALEAALDKKAQAIIVKNNEALEKTLSLLGQNKCSAQFIIYESVKSWKAHNRHKAIMKKEGIPLLLAFIKIEEPYGDIADYLLDDIYIVEKRERAYEMLNKYKKDIKFVTRDGFFVEKGYIFGGPTKNDAPISIIGRTKKLKEIIKKKAQLTTDMEALRARGADQKKIVDLVKKEIVMAENELKKEEIVLANVLSKKESIEADLKKINDEASIVALEISEVGELIHEVSLRGNELNKRLNENEGEYAKVEGFISSSQEEIQDKTKEKNNLIFEISEIKSELSFLENTRLQEERNLDKESRLFEELKTQLESKETRAKDSEEKIAMLETETKDLEEKIDAEKKEEVCLSESLNEISENKDALSENLHAKEKVSREKETFIEDWRNQIRNLEIKNRENQLKVVNIKDRVREAYKMDIETVDIQIEEGTDWEDTKNQIEVLRIKLEKLGPVNLVAIEEHKELEERYAFLTQQEEDLLMAKESLHKAIIKINRTTKKLFIETFQKVQVEFRNYFRMLFGGGHAELLLLDEGDVLESGIEIVARPLGKKLQNLLLLSGGEKALAAIALLFAIFKVKPSPFCILDEVDAPLDESNIGRFTRILQEFLKMSQFIVITHSKKTMQMADILYGITMQEKGVSKIVSVKFAEDERKVPSRKEKVLV